MKDKECKVSWSSPLKIRLRIIDRLINGKDTRQEPQDDS